MLKQTYEMSDFSKNFYYSMDSRHSTFFGARFKLDAAIQTEVLQKALDKTIKRFPYFNRTMYYDGNEIVITDHDQPHRVFEEDLSRLINFSTNDGHLFRISVNGPYLQIQAFHGLTDLGGVYRFIQILLEHYYYGLGEQFETADDIYHHEEVTAAEYANVEKDEAVLQAQAAPYAVKEFFTFPDRQQDSYYMHTFHADAAAFMETAHRIDGSPNAMTAVMLAKAVKKIHPDCDKDIDIAVTINAKPILGYQDSFTPALALSTTSFNEKLFQMDDEMLHTVVRGKIIRDSMESELAKRLGAARKLSEILKQLPSLKARQLLCLKSSSTPRNTATISYVGNYHWGYVEKHIREIHSFADVAAPLLEISCTRESFCFSLIAPFNAAKYMEAMKEMVEAYGIAASGVETTVFTVDETCKSQKPKFGLNLATLQMVTTIAKIKRNAK